MLISLTLAPLVKTQLKSEFLPILLRVNAYRFCIPFCFSTEQNRTNRVDWVRLGSVIELNRTQKKFQFDYVWLPNQSNPHRTIGFDWFLVRFRSINYAGFFRPTIILIKLQCTLFPENGLLLCHIPRYVLIVCLFNEVCMSLREMSRLECHKVLDEGRLP